MGPEFHHEIRNKRLRVAFEGRTIVTNERAGAFVNTSEAYRARAGACLKLAEAINDPHAKLVLASMAEAWLRLADYVEDRRQNEVDEHVGADGSHDQDANLK